MGPKPCLYGLPLGSHGHRQQRPDRGTHGRKLCTAGRLMFALAQLLTASSSASPPASNNVVCFSWSLGVILFSVLGNLDIGLIGGGEKPGVGVV